jgi:hypothetical protein
MKTSLSLILSEHQSLKTQGKPYLLHFTYKAGLRSLNHLLVLIAGWAVCMAAQIQAEDNFTYINSQSALRITLSAPSGSSNIQPSWPAEVVATVVNETWDTYLNSDTGDLDVRNFASHSVPNATVDFVFTNESANASMTTTSMAADSQGNASTWVTLTSGQVTLQATASSDGSSSISTIDLSLVAPDPEEWTYSHSETVISASLQMEGSENGLTLNYYDSRNIVATVTATTTEIWTSTYGNSEPRNVSQAPAQGAQLNWTVTSGGGWFSSTPSVHADGSGQGTGSFVMGSSDVNLQVDVVYAGSYNTYATLQISLNQPNTDTTNTNSYYYNGTYYSTYDEYLAAVNADTTGTETWSYSHTESTTNASITTVNGEDMASLSPWQSYNFKVTINYQSWEVWTSNYGNQWIGNHSSGPATGIPVWLSLNSNGSTYWLNNNFSYTDGNGTVETSGSMPDYAAELQAQYQFNGSDAWATQNLYPLFTPPLPEEWSLSQTESHYNVSSELLQSVGSEGLVPNEIYTVRVYVTQSTRESWSSNWGNSYTTDWVTTAVPNADLNMTFDAGIIPTLNDAPPQTDQNGSWSQDFLVNPNTVGSNGQPLTGTQFTVSFPGLDVPPHNAFFGIPCTIDQETWELASANTQVAPTIQLVDIESSAVTAATELIPGKNYRATLTVQSERIEHWVSSFGNSRTENYPAGPTVGAQVSITFGESLSTAEAQTNEVGQVTTDFTMVYSSASFSISVNYADASVTLDTNLDLMPETWELHRHNTTLNVGQSFAPGSDSGSLESGSGYTLITDIYFTNTEIWKSNYGNEEPRNYTSGVANGATVTLTSPSGDVSMSSNYGSTNSYGQMVSSFTMPNNSSVIDYTVQFLGGSLTGSMPLTLGAALNYGTILGADGGGGGGTDTGGGGTGGTGGTDTGGGGTTTTGMDTDGGSTTTTGTDTGGVGTTTTGTDTGGGGTGGTGGTDTGGGTTTIILPPEFVKDREESSIELDTRLNGNGSVSHTVTFITWEVWKLEHLEQIRNRQESPAIDAQIIDDISDRPFTIAELQQAGVSQSDYGQYGVISVQGNQFLTPYLPKNEGYPTNLPQNLVPSTSAGPFVFTGSSDFYYCRYTASFSGLTAKSILARVKNSSGSTTSSTTVATVTGTTATTTTTTTTTNAAGTEETTSCSTSS